MYIIMLGAPGAGKGTQAHLLAQRLDLAHVASGDLFREAVEKGTPLGLTAKSYMDRGLLVPDEVTIEMILVRLAMPDAQGGAILDGFPRTLEQARALDATGLRVDRVVRIEVSEEELVRRLSGRRICRLCQRPYTEAEASALGGHCEACPGDLLQRPDDRPEVVRQRLQVYSARTAPLVDYYAAQGKLVDVNGERVVTAVAQEILKTLGVEG